MGEARPAFRVVDFSTHISGPLASYLLREFGAEVIGDHGENGDAAKPLDVGAKGGPRAGAGRRDILLRRQCGIVRHHDCTSKPGLKRLRGRETRMRKAFSFAPLGSGRGDHAAAVRGASVHFG